MARPTLFSNRKFLKLAQRLQSDALAIGHLEFIWHAANESGNAVLGDADDVEATARWRGARGELVAALMECGSLGAPGFIVLNDRSLYEIHDYWHHAPDYVRKRARREQERRTNGDEIRRGNQQNDQSPTGHSAPHEAESDRSLTSHRPVTDQSPTGQNAVGSPENADFFRTPTPTRLREEKISSTVVPILTGSSTRAEAARAPATAIPDNWQPNEINRRWLADAGLSEQQQAEVIGEFTRFAHHSKLRRANWDRTFSSNPVVKSAVGRAKSGGSNGAHRQGSGPRPSAVERVERATAEWARKRGVDPESI